MLFFKTFKVRSYQTALLFHDGEFRGLVGEGTHYHFDPLDKLVVVIADRRAPFFSHEKLDLIVKTGLLKGEAQVVDLKDDQRALVWVDGRFARILGPGQHAFWISPREVRVETTYVRQPRFEHEDSKVITRNLSAREFLENGAVSRGCAGVLFLDGRYVETLEPGSVELLEGCGGGEGRGGGPSGDDT